MACRADLTQITLQNGSAGGIYNYGTLGITKSTITSNTEGGIENEVGTITLQGCQITHNTASVAGGIWNEGGSVTLTDTSITCNSRHRLHRLRPAGS